MIEIIDKKKCNGCHACKNICPKKCITLEEDSEGFWYPKIDKIRCIECNLCEKVCSLKSNNFEKRVDIRGYACKNVNMEVRKESSSGGVFSILCKSVIERNGVVFGAKYNEDFEVIHDYTEKYEECHEFRGAKYVQSKIGNSYIYVKKFLMDDKYVLFSGTPCQIAGLRYYLQRDYDKLILVDIVCHGVPSPLVYRKYINYIKKKNNDDIKKINFRDKSSGWQEYSFSVKFVKEEFKQRGYDNIYMKGFLNDMYLRPSCYECPFKKPITYSDITLGDYWGINEKYRYFNDDNGVSLVIVNTDKGQEEINRITNQMDIIEADIEHAYSRNPSIVESAKYSFKRDEFFKTFINEWNSDVEYIIERYTREKFASKVKKKIRAIKKLVIK